MISEQEAFYAAAMLDTERLLAAAEKTPEYARYALKQVAYTLECVIKYAQHSQSGAARA
jgi:hypothetical protein